VAHVLRAAAMLRAVAMPAAVVASLAPAPAALGAEGDAARGERAFQRCYACHSVDGNESAKLQGPNLAGVVGRRAASVAGFDYSDPMKAKGAAGLVWTPEALDRYLADPKAFVPGTLMSVPPLDDPQARADLIAYLSGPRR
jgi:cytochrome c